MRTIGRFFGFLEGLYLVLIEMYKSFTFVFGFRNFVRFSRLKGMQVGSEQFQGRFCRSLCLGSRRWVLITRICYFFIFQVFLRILRFRVGGFSSFIVKFFYLILSIGIYGFCGRQLVSKNRRRWVYFVRDCSQVGFCILQLFYIDLYFLEFREFRYFLECE